MARIRKGKDLKNWSSPRLRADRGKLRIIGGQFRGRQINYSGDPVTRPMKDDIREAVFNLIGGWTPGKAVFDLFSGTGAMGLEALSRGASRAYLIERHIPTVRIIRENVDLLGPQLPLEIAAADTFFWSRKFLSDVDNWPSEPWIVFCCPPYDFYTQRELQMLQLIGSFQQAAPDGSILVVESDQRFDVKKLPAASQWQIRRYSPATISIFKKSLRVDS